MLTEYFFRSTSNTLYTTYLNHKYYSASTLYFSPHKFWVVTFLQHCTSVVLSKVTHHTGTSSFHIPKIWKILKCFRRSYNLAIDGKHDSKKYFTLESSTRMFIISLSVLYDVSLEIFFFLKI